MQMDFDDVIKVRLLNNYLDIEHVLMQLIT